VYKRFCSSNVQNKMVTNFGITHEMHIIRGVCSSNGQNKMVTNSASNGAGASDE
jgi:hypothetical protein